MSFCCPVHGPYTPTPGVTLALCPQCSSTQGMPITTALRASEAARDPSMYQWHTWRIGSKVGRTIHAQLGELPSDDDPLIGVMDTPQLAEEIVNSHNAALARVQTKDEADG